MQNYAVIMGWIRYNKAIFIQDRNPGVPGVMYKIVSESEERRKSLDNVRTLWKMTVELTGVPLYEIYTGKANLGAFQVEMQAEVGVAGAKALGQMGVNGAGDINLSCGGEGFNMAAMMASMAVGGAVGQNIAGSMNNMMAGINQPMQTGMTPPPVPTVKYNVAVNGQATGPFDLVTLQKMAIAGQFVGSSLVWKAGMSTWVAADTVDELKDVLANVMPPIPQ